jgi:cytochrome c oxidase cbb3-type subunit 2
MKRGWVLSGGICLALALSWVGLVWAPQFQLGALGMTPIEETGADYPQARSGMAARGARIYRANGCQYCHTQVVRGAREGMDLARGWGSRRTVPRDYLRDAPVLLGRVRHGPDLANLGLRENNPGKLLLRLYDPRAVTPGSLMPRYPYLFAERRLRPGEPRSVGALRFPADYSLPPGVDEVVPLPAAQMLAAYLRSLQARPLFFEVFPPLPPGAEKTNAPPAPSRVVTNRVTAPTPNAIPATTNAPSAPAP